nr:pantoate--beta-alanine ligase [Paenibacillus nasutitermitis]
MALYKEGFPGSRVGLVPTMGFLHEGHASLMKRAKEECDFTVLSVFVNPLQFGPNEDFDRYPRDKQRDAALAENNGIDVLFMPDVSEMYPTKPLTRVLLSEVTERLCGASRPGHFDGVGTVVSKLFHLIQPDRAYFGMKDAQQVAVVERMVSDLDFSVEIIRCPTLRESDGLAMSSRNVFLNEEERRQAIILNSALEQAEQWAKEPGMTAPLFKERLSSYIGQAPLADIDYAELLHYPDLTDLPDDMELAASTQPLIIAIAVRFGDTRLIDNRIVEQKWRCAPHV